MKGSCQNTLKIAEGNLNLRELFIHIFPAVWPRVRADAIRTCFSPGVDYTFPPAHNQRSSQCESHKSHSRFSTRHNEGHRLFTLSTSATPVDGHHEDLHTLGQRKYGASVRRYSVTKPSELVHSQILQQADEVTTVFPTNNPVTLAFALQIH